MQPGSVIVDLAAATGGNCELTRADEVVVEHGVTILGPTDLPSQLCADASRMYAKNIVTMLLNMTAEGAVDIDKDDEIVTGTMVARGGEIVHPMVKDKLEAQG